MDETGVITSGAMTSGVITSGETDLLGLAMEESEEEGLED